MKQHPITCFILYSISCLLDALDGYFARLLNQATKFGAVLDMVTDRCTTSCLLCFLATAYPQFVVIGMGLISLDLASHYMHMYASLESGSKSHKLVDEKRSRILNLYYSNNVCGPKKSLYTGKYVADTSNRKFSSSFAPVTSCSSSRSIFLPSRGCATKCGLGPPQLLRHRCV